MKSAVRRWITIGAWILVATSSGIPQSDSLVSTPGYHETSYISTDKDIFSPGEVIYYSCYMVDQEGSPSAVRSGIYYVELIDHTGKIINRRKTRIENGNGQAYINLSATLPAGPYWLRGYSKYCLLNYEAGIFSKSIYILPENAHPTRVTSPPNLQHMYFFPEGGQLIPDTPCRIIAAGVDNNNQLTPIDGTLKDDQGIEIAQIASDSLGFIDFTFTPESNKKYSAEIKLASGEKKVFPLPRHSGPASIHLTKLEDDILLLKLAVNSNNVNRGKLMIHSGHQLIMENEILSGDFSQEIDLKELPPGLLVFNFRSTDDQLISERLFFNETALQPCYVDLYTDWEDSDSLVELILHLEAYDDEGLPRQAVYDLKIVPKNEPFGQTITIEDYFLVLKYLDPHSEIIFPDLNIHAASLIDKFLITQNARPLEIRADAQPLSAIEESLKLSGTVFNKNKPYQMDGFYSGLSNLMNLNIFQSDEDGNFEIANLEVIDTTDVIFFFNSGKQNNRSEKQTFKGNTNFSIEFDSIHWPDKVDIHSLATSFIPPFEINQEINQDPGISVDLGTIEVRAKRLDAYVEYHKPTMLYSRPDDRVQVDSSLLSQGQTNIIDFLRGKVPNFEVSNESGDRQVILRGRTTGLSQNISMSNAAQFMVNGFAVTPAYAETINPLDVAFVDIIRSLSQTSVYGEFGRNGIIAIYLKPPHQRYRKPVEREGMISRMLVGYARSIPFQARRHASPNATLYWSGIRQMDAEGMAEMKIPLRAPREDMQIIIEGLTPSGTPIFLSKSISTP